MVSTTHTHAKQQPTTPKVKAPAVACEFVMPGCQHEKIFHEEYLRSNRTCHSKIMRCFPHCCPGHRPRSYCGAPLHVKIKSNSPETEDQLVVFGRFRPVHLPPFGVGERIKTEIIQASLQRLDPSKNEWVESKISRHETEPLLFGITPHDHWYYPWSGAATVAMRATHHVFEAIVFCHVSETELEVVAQISSPKFRLKSFRRNGPTTTNREAGGKASPRVRPKRKAVTRAPIPTEELTPQSSPDNIVSNSSDSSTAAVPHDAHKHESQLPRRRVSPPPIQETLSPATTMDMLLSWLQGLSANSAGSRLLLSWQRAVLDACETHVAATQNMSSARAGLVPILSALDIIDAPVLPQRVTQRRPPSLGLAPSSPLNTIDAAVRVLLNEWLDLDCLRASASSVERAVLRGFPLGRSDLAAAHDEWLASVARRAQRFIHQRATAPWSQLIAAAEGSHDELDGSTVSSEFSYRNFVARTREARLYRTKRRQSTESRHKRQWTAGAERNVVPDGLRRSARVWTNHMEDVAIETSGINTHALSLLTVLEFWKHLSCLRLDFAPAAGPPAQFSVASVFNTLVNDGSFTKLTLDGQYRWFNCLPSGEPTVGTTLMGYVVGDYVGRATSAGRIHITTYLWPATADNAAAFAWHWTIDAASLSRGSSSSVVSVVVESASVGRTSHAMETMSMAEKLRCVGRWQHACELRLVYNSR